MSDLIDLHIAHIRAAGYSTVTASDRAEVLRRMDRDLPYGLESATTEELAAWLAHPGWSAQTRATYYGHVRAFYRWACDESHTDYLSFDPSAGLTRPRVPKRAPRPVTDAQLQHALNTLVDPWLRYVLLAYHAGLRACEIVKLERADVTERTLTVRQGKGGYSDVLPTHPAIWRSIEQLPDGYVCHIEWPGSLSQAVSKQLTAIGLPGATLHRFRHSFATDLLRHGVSIRVVQELLRHRSLSSTAMYTAVTDEERRLAICTLLPAA